MRCFKGPQAERNHAGQAVGGHAVVGRALVRPLVIVTVVAHLSARGSRRLCALGASRELAIAPLTPGTAATARTHLKRARIRRCA